MGTSAAVVLAAMYQRSRRVTGHVPPTINLDEWSDAAFTTLFQMGFFETVGHIIPDGSGFRDSEAGEIRTMTMITGENATTLRSACEAILGLSGFINDAEPLRPDVQLALNSALGEAMSNVAAHAYPEPEIESEAQKLRVWWVSASADRRTRTLRVVIYDHGASIPVTLPKREWFVRLAPRNLLATIYRDPLVPHPHDADYIQFAMGRGNTQTDEPGRGEGLPQMRELVEICGRGSLTILSRGGICCYRPEHEMFSQALPVTIEGTLIEWEMHLPKAA